MVGTGVQSPSCAPGSTTTSLLVTHEVSGKLLPSWPGQSPVQTYEGPVGQQRHVVTHAGVALGSIRENIRVGCKQSVWQMVH